MDKKEDKGTFKIRITNSKLKKDLIDSLFTHKHFENLFVIILKENPDDFNYLSNYEVMRAVIRNTEGGKRKEEVKDIKLKYKDDEKMKDLIEISKNLKVHNLCSIIKRVKGNYKSFFTKNKKGDKKARPPKAKKLKDVNKYSLPLDVNSWSIKKKDKIGINLNDKMFYIPFKHEHLDKITNDKDNIQNISIVYTNGDIYLTVLYHKIKSDKVFSLEEEKYAAIDLGINNLCALFIDDKDSDSVLLQGTNYISYNAQFNRLLSKNKTSLSKEVTEYEEKNGKFYPKEYSKRGKDIKGFISYIYEKRNRYYTNEFHKLSKRIVEYLLQCGVTTLVLSKNLADAKNEEKKDKKKKMGKKANQKFIEIPIIRLLNYIETKCYENGIQIEYIDEAYTSKCSCITDDVNNPKSTELNGVRSKRGLFKDKLVNKIWNADLNGAVNHIRKHLDNSYTWLVNYLRKLCNPIAIKCDYDFVQFLKTNRVSNKVKLYV